MEWDAPSTLFAENCMDSIARLNLPASIYGDGRTAPPKSRKTQGSSLEAHLAKKEFDERAAEVALHFAQGGEIPRALPYLERADEQALARYAHAEAERIYRELLRHYEQPGRPLDAAHIKERLGWVLAMMPQHDEARGQLLLYPYAQARALYV